MTQSQHWAGSNGGQSDPDQPHIDRRQFLLGVGAVAGAGALAAVLPPSGQAAAADARSTFSALPVAVRVLDTRDPSKYDYIQLGDSHVRVPINDKYGVPDDAIAIVATFTSVNHGGPNWMTVVPAGTDIGGLLATNKLNSALNSFGYREATANLVHVKLANGGVDVYGAHASDLILDIIGYYVPVSGGARAGRFIGLTPARRALDSRGTFGFIGAGQSVIVDITSYVPADVSSVMINLTATECQAPGYFTAYSYDESAPPDTSSLNVNSYNETRAAAVIVPVATQTNGRRFIKLFGLTPAKLIVDVTGYYTSETSATSEVGLFVPVDPVRIFDSRTPPHRLWPGWTVEGAIPGAGATAGRSAVVNVTGVDSLGPGFVTISAARTSQPATSNLNFSSWGQIVPNHAVTPITAGHGFQVFASGGAHVIVDYAGYFTGTPGAAVTGPPVNPDPPPIGPEWVLRIPQIGVETTVKGGNSIWVTDSGHTWHWTDSGFMGEDAHVAVFAHRTTHGGVFRNLHLLAAGDRFTVTTADAREYTYEVVRRDLTNSLRANILAATQTVPGRSFSMIACSRTNFLPTNTAFRIVVSAAYVGWRDI